MRLLRCLQFLRAFRLRNAFRDMWWPPSSPAEVINALTECFCWTPMHLAVRATLMPLTQSGRNVLYCDRIDRCPECGFAPLYRGYGFACGGGIGTYELCERCLYSHKTLDTE